jgi:hypothetical protein
MFIHFDCPAFSHPEGEGVARISRRVFLFTRPVLQAPVLVQQEFVAMGIPEKIKTAG